MKYEDLSKKTGQGFRVELGKRKLSLQCYDSEQCPCLANDAYRTKGLTAVALVTHSNIECGVEQNPYKN